MLFWPLARWCGSKKGYSIVGGHVVRAKAGAQRSSFLTPLLDSNVICHPFAPCLSSLLFSCVSCHFPRLSVYFWRSSLYFPPSYIYALRQFLTERIFGTCIGWGAMPCLSPQARSLITAVSVPGPGLTSTWLTLTPIAPVACAETPPGTLWPRPERPTDPVPLRDAPACCHAGVAFCLAEIERSECPSAPF